MEINMGTDIHDFSTHIRGKGPATIFGEPSLHYGDSLPFLMLIKTSSGLLTQYQIMYFSMEVTISSVLTLSELHTSALAAILNTFQLKAHLIINKLAIVTAHSLRKKCSCWKWGLTR